MSAAIEKKPIKKKRPMYTEDIKKKAVSLFDEGKSPKEIVDLLKTIFSGQKTPKVKAVRRYIRTAGKKINGK